MDLEQIIQEFDIRGYQVSTSAIKTGHIHDTFLVETEAVRVILQRMNRHVFPDVDAVMANIVRVTDHLRSKRPAAGVDRHVLRFINTRDGAPWHEDPDGGAWRAYIYVGEAESRRRAPTVDEARVMARTFGEFQRDLVDLPGPRLQETIPCFHDTPARFEAFRRAADTDRCGRADGAAAEIAFAMERETLSGALASGEIPERITHNDAKLDNILFDLESGEALCVIDLDTVMPGSALYDFGDMVRSGVSLAAEDESDVAAMEVRMPVFESLVGGYLEGTGDLLTEGERARLVLSGRLMTFEVGLRFLTDFLEGDHYFKTDHPEHNLVRARAQFRLLQLLEEHAEEMQQIVDGPRKG